MHINISPNLSQAYPGVCCGFLAVECAGSPANIQPLEDRKNALVDELRAQYLDEASLKADPVLQAYAAYYKRFKKTYHVALQLQSVAHKGKSIPSVTPLVQCMFMAELQNRLLTAGHNLDVLQAAGGTLRVEVAQGGEGYTLLRGTPQELKAGDLYMADGAGILSSIIYGPDQRTQITPETSRALYTVYAPPCIGSERVEQHLGALRELVCLAYPGARVLQMEVYD